MTQRFHCVVTLTILWIFFLALISSSTAAATEGAKRPAGVSAQAWKRIKNQLEADHYRITPDRLASRWRAANRRQGYLATFDEKFVRFSSRNKNASWEWGMETVGFGREGRIHPVSGANVAVRGNRLEYRRGALTEWYENRRRGLEQGFTVKAPPPEGIAPLAVELALTGGLRPRLDRKNQVLTLHHGKGGIVLRYAGLKAFDAHGKKLPARLALRKLDPKSGAARLALLVEDAGAVYPVTIDPVITNETKKLLASDGAADDQFGRSVSIDGNTLVVGAYFDDDKGTDSGSAYVFGRNVGGPGNWGEVQKITASDGAAMDWFGTYISISGNTIVVGVPRNDHNGSNSGSAYLFEQNPVPNPCFPNPWCQVKKLTPADGSAGDEFGSYVSIDGDTIVVGAPYDDDNFAGNSGSVYVFGRNEGGADNWGQVKKLTASDGAAFDLFGWSVSIDGDMIVVGAPYDDDNVGDSGSAYVFGRNEGGANNWGQVKKLTASDGAFRDLFGESVSIDGDTIVVGVRFRDDKGFNSGSAYVFGRDVGGTNNWGQVKKLTASDGAGSDEFGRWVSISGDSIVVGAPQDDDNGLNSGSAYVFGRNEGGADNWGEVEKLLASDGQGNDALGLVVSISGDTIVAGAIGDRDNGIFSGSAYVFGGDSNPDMDGDGIANEIDGTFNGGFTDESDTPSTNFTDQHLGGTSFGSIGFLIGGIEVTVTDAADPFGFRIEARGSGFAVVRICGFRVFLTDGDVVNATCRSLDLEVVEGPVEIELGDEDNPILVDVPAGGEVKITETGGTFRIENLSDAESITVETGGQVITLGPGQVNGSCDCGAPGAIVGTIGSDFLYGTKGDDIICGLNGNDVIYGRGGNDCIDAGPGNDTVFGGGGNDTVFGRDGNDILYGNEGNDTIAGEGGNDMIFGNRGEDEIDGGDGGDFIAGGGGTDMCINGELSFSCESP